MNKVEEALGKAQAEIAKIHDPRLRQFSEIIFAPNGTKVPRDSAEHARPLADHADVDTIIESGIVRLFTLDLQAAGRLLQAINLMHEATGARTLSLHELTDHIGTIVVNAVRMKEGYDM